MGLPWSRDTVASPRFPRYRARPDDDPDCHPPDDESGAEESSQERASTPRRTHYRTSAARFSTSSSAHAGYESEDGPGESPLWGPFFSVLSLFAKKDQPEQRGVVERWRAESGALADSG